MSTRPDKSAKRQIVGFSIPPELAVNVKMEAAERGLSLRKLFEEMWDTYRKSRRKVGS